MLQFIKDNFFAILLIVVILYGRYLLGRKAERDDRKRMIDNATLHTKKEKEFFAGKNRPKKLYIDFKGKLIEPDELWSEINGISEDKIN